MFSVGFVFVLKFTVPYDTRKVLLDSITVTLGAGAFFLIMSLAKLVNSDSFTIVANETRQDIQLTEYTITYPEYKKYSSRHLECIDGNCSPITLNLQLPTREFAIRETTNVLVKPVLIPSKCFYQSLEFMEIEDILENNFVALGGLYSPDLPWLPFVDLFKRDFIKHIKTLIPFDVNDTTQDIHNLMPIKAEIPIRHFINIQTKECYQPNPDQIRSISRLLVYEHNLQGIIPKKHLIWTNTSNEQNGTFETIPSDTTPNQMLQLAANANVLCIVGKIPLYPILVMHEHSILITDTRSDTLELITDALGIHTLYSKTFDFSLEFLSNITG